MSAAFDYEAKCVRENLQGNSLPSFYEIIKDYMLKNRSAKVKTGDIVDHVAFVIGDFPDHPIHQKVADNLIKLEKENVVCHVSHGYWKAI